MAYYILNSYKLKSTPLEIFEALKEKNNCFFLDSSLNSNYSLGRYSFLGIEPFLKLTGNGDGTLARLRRLLEIYKIPAGKDIPPFLGGAVGYLSYDLGFTLEPRVRPMPKPRAGIPRCFFAFYNTAIIIDHWQRSILIFSCGFPEKKYQAAEKIQSAGSYRRKTFRLGAKGKNPRICYGIRNNTNIP
jgi:anthranilate/para-aminobenzoate synthase component I